MSQTLSTNVCLNDGSKTSLSAKTIANANQYLFSASLLSSEYHLLVVQLCSGLQFDYNSSQADAHHSSSQHEIRHNTRAGTALTALHSGFGCHQLFSNTTLLLFNISIISQKIELMQKIASNRLNHSNRLNCK